MHYTLYTHSYTYVLGQRVLATPLCIRQHYGHPDLFDKFFTMTEGGMSKGTLVYSMLMCVCRVIYMYMGAVYYV